jgi:replicative DNA helicase
MSENIQGKVPPQNIEAEKAVLAAIMIEKNAIAKVVHLLKSDYFYKHSHSLIYSACITLFSKSEPIDLITVTADLRKTGDLETVGGPKYLVDILESVNSSMNLEFHARLVLECSTKRELIKMASEVLKRSYDPTEDVFDVMEDSQTSLVKISQGIFTKGPKTMADLIPVVIKETEENMNKPEGITGIVSGLVSVDSLTGGWQRQDLIVLAGRPGMGKTALAIKLAKSPYLLKRMTVLIFSLEMSDKSIAKRIISSESKVKYSQISKGTLSQEQFRDIHDIISDVYTDKILIDDTPAPNILQIRSKAMNVKLEKGLDLVIIDYLQLCSGVEKSKGNREQEIAGISRGLKAMAKELDIPVIALSQLSRSVEQRGGDKRPMLSDLRESGAIEQDADLVVFLYRPEYYFIEQYDDGSSTKDTAELIFAKHRNGALDTIKVGCKVAINNFHDIEEPMETPEQIEQLPIF